MWVKMSKKCVFVYFRKYFYWRFFLPFFSFNLYEFIKIDARFTIQWIFHCKLQYHTPYLYIIIKKFQIVHWIHFPFLFYYWTFRSLVIWSSTEAKKSIPKIWITIKKFACRRENMLWIKLIFLPLFRLKSSKIKIKMNKGVRVKQRNWYPCYKNIFLLFGDFVAADLKVKTMFVVHLWQNIITLKVFTQFRLLFIKESGIAQQVLPFTHITTIAMTTNKVFMFFSTFFSFFFFWFLFFQVL